MSYADVRAVCLFPCSKCCAFSIACFLSIKLAKNNIDKFMKPSIWYCCKLMQIYLDSWMTRIIKHPNVRHGMGEVPPAVVLHYVASSWKLMKCLKYTFQIKDLKRVPVCLFFSKRAIIWIKPSVILQSLQGPRRPFLESVHSGKCYLEYSKILSVSLSWIFPLGPGYSWMNSQIECFFKIHN